MLRLAAVALFEREARIAFRGTRGLGSRDRHVAAGEVAGIALAEAGPPHVPPRVGAERRLQYARAQPVDVVAVGIGLRCERRVLSDDDRRLDRNDAGAVVSVMLPERRSKVVRSVLACLTGRVGAD